MTVEIGEGTRLRCLVLPCDFNQNLNYSLNFSTTSQCKISNKSARLYTVVTRGQPDEQQQHTRRVQKKTELFK